MSGRPMRYGPRFNNGRFHVSAGVVGGRGAFRSWRRQYEDNAARNAVDDCFVCHGTALYRAWDVKTRAYVGACQQHKADLPPMRAGGA